MFKKIYAYFENLVTPYPNLIPAVKAGNLSKFIWLCIYGFKKYIAIIIILTMVLASFEAIIFSNLKTLTDQISITTAANIYEDCKETLIILFLLLSFEPFIRLMRLLIKFQIIQGNLPMRQRWNFHRLLLNQSVNFFHEEFAGGLANKVMQTALAVREIIYSLLDVCAYIPIYFISAAFMLGSFNIYLLLPFGTWFILYTLVACYFIPRLTKAANDQADLRSLVTGRIVDAYTNISIVKLFSHSKQEAGYAKESMENFMHPVVQQSRLLTSFNFITALLNAILIISISSLSIWLWAKGEVSVGVIIAAISMAMRFDHIFEWGMWVVAGLFEEIGVVKNGMDLLSKTISLKDKPDARPLEVTNGIIEFKDVSFSYGTDKHIINNLNLKIKTGEKIGLVGRSGAGKSTIVNLLLRFYDVDKGSICIDGQDIRDVTQDSLRRQIGMVTQDTSLLHRSIRENIIYGALNALEEDMIAASKRAEAHLFIQDLEDSAGRRGFDAHVGERGVKLSGGQRQRISIARVVLKNAPILLLDEATSALDSEIEAAIQSSLDTLMEGKTVIAIAHRLSTIAAMDRLIVLDKGQIIEDGTHQELLSKNGLYAQLWNRQSGGFLGDNF
jgi:ATP-binding cassette subfamily B multidrug efflux pump